MAVVLFHARVPGFTGGYVGVDVFFVISGYLITRQLLIFSDRSITDMLSEFYMRRARRILPALGVVLLFVLIAASILLYPSDLAQLGKAATLSILFAGNFITWQNGAYFAEGPNWAPLVHLWTIAIEEQFYLIFPFVLWAGRRALTRNQLFIAFATCAAFSLGICIRASYTHPVANFYLAPFRAWELILGALIALRPMEISSPFMRKLLAVLALVTLGASIFAYDSNTRFPGTFTLAPCLATAVLIVTGTHADAATSRILANRWLVSVGLISYSLYLWHYPLQTLLEYYNIRELDALQTAASVVASLLLSVVTWKLIEQPIRRRQLLASGPAFVACMVSGAVCLTACSLGFWGTRGLPDRYPDDVLASLVTGASLHPETQNCFAVFDSGQSESCRFGTDEPEATKAVLWGDSHALALLPAFDALADQFSVSLRFFGTSGCRPLLGVASRRDAAIGNRRCEDFNLATLDAVRRIDPSLIILAAYWIYPTMELVAIDTDLTRSEDLFAAGLESLLDRPELRNRSICAVLDVPIFRRASPNAHVRAVRRGMSLDFLSIDHSQAVEQLKEAETLLERVATERQLRLADPKQSLCTDGLCSALSSEGQLLYRDSNHLNVSGAAYVASTLAGCFGH